MLNDDIPGTSRDICSRCGGWISLGHKRGSACREEIGEAIKTQAMKRDIERLTKQKV